MNITYINRATGKKEKETPPGEGLLKFLYTTGTGQLTLNALVKRKLISALYGRMMDSRSSRRRIQPFVDQLGIDMSEAAQPVDAYTSFNDFFYRKLKPEARPLGEGLVSPGDGKLLAFELAEEVNEFFVKGQRFTLSAFLQDEALAKRYRQGVMVILRLAPNDYHRYHFPYAGTPKAPTKINGRYLSVSPYALAEHFTRVFCENKRELTELTTPDRGHILLCPVGATMVGSIHSTYTPGQAIAKGDEMGYFAFGGSTVVMLLESGRFAMDEDLLDNTRSGMETFVKMGERIGR